MFDVFRLVLLQLRTWFVSIFELLSHIGLQLSLPLFIVNEELGEVCELTIDYLVSDFKNLSPLLLKENLDVIAVAVRVLS